MTEDFILTILGSNSAIPAYGRYPTSQVLKVNEELFLIDCGEGAQMRFQQYKLKKNKLKAIFISHMHGDHVFGLPGLLSSMNLAGRKEKLVLFGPPGIKDYLHSIFKYSFIELDYDLQISEMEEGHSELFINTSMKVSSFPVYHRIPTYGFRFQELTKPKNIIKEVIAEYNLTVDHIKAVKRGEDLNIDGKLVKNKELTKPSRALCSYTYCADSKVDMALLPFIKDTVGLYFETTYKHDLQNQAHDRGHATAKEAGELAAKANCKVLITGHYSSRYKNVDDLVEEAKAEFNQVIKGYDGCIVTLTQFL